MNKLTSLHISVPYKGPGNTIHQQIVNFDVIKHESFYSLVPCLTENERRLANLPEELQFRVQEGQPESLRGAMDGNFHVIQDAFRKMKELHLDIN